MPLQLGLGNVPPSVALLLLFGDEGTRLLRPQDGLPKVFFLFLLFLLFIAVRKFRPVANFNTPRNEV